MRDPSLYDSKIKTLYCIEGMTMKQVADSLKIAVGKVYNRLKHMGVKSRSQGDYEPTVKVRESGKRQGLKMKGRKHSAKTKEKMSEAKFRGGVGAKKKRDDGYICIYFPEHPKADKEGLILEHRLVMECYIGRWLSDDECVHHINHKRDDNRLCNLKLMTKREHMSMHMRERNANRKNKEE